MEQKRRKMKKIILGVMLFLFVVLIATYATYSYYTNYVVSGILKNEILESMQNHDLAFFFENEMDDQMRKKVKEENHELDSHITLSTTMEDTMFSDFDLSKFEWNYHTAQNKPEKKAYHKWQMKYAGNDFIIFDFLTNDHQVAMKSDEIVNRYVGVERSNFQNTVNQIKQAQVDLSDFQAIKNFTLDREWLDFSQMKHAFIANQYANVIKENIPKDIAKKENVVVTMNAENLETTEYTISFQPEQVNHFMEGLSKVVQEDEEWIPHLVVDKAQEEENSSILKYTDNDNLVQVPGTQDNFNTSLEIWGENTVNEEQVLNTIPANTVLPENNTTNTETIDNTVTNEITNQVSNSVSVENTTPIEQTTPPEALPEPPTQAPEPTPTPEPEQTAPEPIPEEDNFRTQGFIEINDDSYDESEDNPFIGENYEETWENITKWIQKIDWNSYWLTGAKANGTKQELKDEIQYQLAKRGKQNNSLVVKWYVSQGKVVKVHFEIPETLESLDIAVLSKSEKEKYLNVSFLVGEEQKASGRTVSIYHKKSDTSVKTKINVNQVNQNKIKQKIFVDEQTKSNGKKYTTDLELVYSDKNGELKAQFQNSLNFEVAGEIEDLNSENCLFLDTLPQEELVQTAEAIQQKTIEVFREKNRNFNMIDINHSNSIVQQTEQKTMTEEQKIAKEQAKQAFIQTVANQMRDYQNEGRQLKLEDLNGLQMEGYEVEISITSNLALITINGYKFKLDSDFNLSDS